MIKQYNNRFNLSNVALNFKRQQLRFLAAA